MKKGKRRFLSVLLSATLLFSTLGGQLTALAQSTEPLDGLTQAYNVEEEGGYVRTYDENDPDQDVDWNAFIADNPVEDPVVADGVLTFPQIKAKAKLIDNESPVLGDSVYTVRFQLSSDIGRFGLLLKANAETNSYLQIAYDNSGKWTYANHTVTGQTFATNSKELAANTWYTLKATLSGQDLKLELTEEDGTTTVIGSKTLNVVPEEPGQCGFLSWYDTKSVVIDSISYVPYVDPSKPTTEKINTIASDQMTVSIDEYFPRVKSYAMADGRIVDGRLNPINVLVINDNLSVPLLPSNVEFTKVNDNEAEYKLHVQSGDIDSMVTARFKVEGNILSFDITEVQNNGAENINYLEIPEWSLVSVNNKGGAVAEFEGARMSQNVDVIGDTNTVIDENYVATESETDWLYAFVSNDEMSAAVYSNSENNSFRRIVASSYTVTEGEESYAAMGLGSARWVIQDPAMDTQNTVMPSTKVIITGDANANGEINWQDGAIAIREIMDNPQGWEEIADQVSMRITHNFASIAANPFLSALDNTKKVYLNTDGLGQKVLMKGYGGEGHDSNHSDYGYVGKRIGGAEDFNTLTQEGAKYGAVYGVHINDTETYPEAASFDPEYLRGNEPNPMGKPYGWSWLDSSYYIDTFKDYVSGSRMSRLQSLKDQVPGINFVYVDVWYAGDQMSDSGGAWESVKFAEEINSLDWTLATEWAQSFEGDSTFSHWATDMDYGGKTTKGINSQVIRFIANHQRDTWMGNYPKNGGTMVGPLLGGADLQGFEGWGGRQNYGQFIRTTFNTNLPTKFLQHYTVSSWENFEDGTEKEIQLVNEDNSQKIVVSRGEMPEGSTANGTRVMTLNGKTILIDNQEIVNGTSTPHTSYLLPWYWTEGELNANDTERLYHYNSDGGATTWDMPAGWENVTTVKLYKLTDQGKTEETTLPVNGGKVTINAEAETPYVLYKEAVAQTEVEYGTGTHMIDPGFTSGNLDAWEVEGDGASIDGMHNYSTNIKDPDGNNRLMIAGNTATTTVSQTLSGLTPGQEYTAMVYVQNDAQDAKASLSVNAGGQVEEAYTYESIARMIPRTDPHEETYMQRMYVHFTAPADGSAVTLTMSREAAEEAAYFDDLRIIEDDEDNRTEDGAFVQDFEDDKPGIYPFVTGTGDGDNLTHRSERHDPYTQRGWTWEANGVTTLIDDVINGDWSVKLHCGYNRRNGVMFQTIPQTLRFEAGKTYLVSFKYEFVTEGEYQIAIGNGESNDIQLIPLETTPDGYKTAQFAVTGDTNGQTWFGIYCSTANQNLTEAAAAAGEHDFVLDDLYVDEIENAGDTSELRALYNANKVKFEEDYESGWTEYRLAMDQAEEVLNTIGADQATIDEAKQALETALGNLVLKPVSGYHRTYDEADSDKDVDWNAFITDNTVEDPVIADGILTFPQIKAKAKLIDNKSPVLDDAVYTFTFRYNDGDGRFGLLLKANADTNSYLQLAYDTDGTWTYANHTVTGQIFAEDSKPLEAGKWYRLKATVVGKLVTLELTEEDGTKTLIGSKELDVVPEEAGQCGFLSWWDTKSINIDTLTYAPYQEEEIDKSSLESLYQENVGKTEGVYTTGSWATFQTAMENAKAVLDNADATQTEINEATAALQSAVDGLVNISTLEYVLNIANGHVAAGDVDKLVPSAQEVFNKVLASAQAIYDDPDATQEQVDTAWKTLMYAIQAMGFVPGDKTELIDLVAEAKALDLNAYEDGAEKDAFTAALKAAEDLIADPDAMVLDIDAAYNALSDAMQNLIPKPAEGDKTELKKVIDEADIKNSELDRYVDDADAKQKFADALAAAKEGYEKDGATQDEIDQAKNNLIDAMTGLRLRADKDNLNKWLEDLNSIDLSQYTEESAAVVRAVIAKAEALAAQDLDEDDQDLINAMVAEMAIAKAQLVPAPADSEDPENPNPGNGSGESSNPESSKPNGDASSQNEANSEGKEATDEIPTTGDATPIAGLSLLAIAAAGTVLLIKKRKS